MCTCIYVLLCCGGECERTRAIVTMRHVVNTLCTCALLCCGGECERTRAIVTMRHVRVSVGECKVSIQLAHAIPTVRSQPLDGLATTQPNDADFLRVPAS